MRPKSEFYTPERDEEHPHPFHMRIAPRGGFIYTSRLLPGIKEPNRRHTRQNLISVIRMDLYRYQGQMSLPIRLEKGKYHYMETRMKDDHFKASDWVTGLNKGPYRGQPVI